MDFQHLLIFGANVISVFVIFVAYRNYSVLPKSLRFLAHLLLSYFLVQLIAAVLIVSGLNPALFYKATLLIYFWLTYKVFYNLFSRRRSILLLRILYLTGLLALVIHYAFSYSNENNLSDSIFIENLVVILSCVLFYYRILKAISPIPLRQQWQFILVTGFFSYTLVSSAFSLSELFTSSIGGSHYDLLNIHNFIYLLELSLFMWAILIFLKTHKKRIGE